jgi:hypothetical protein
LPPVEKKEEWAVRLLPLVAMVGLLWFSGLARADSPVHFADSALKAGVEQALGISNPTPSDMLALTSLCCWQSGIRSLTGLEYAKNLRELSLNGNPITDLSPLAGLTSLQSLIMEDNIVSDLSPLAGLANLRILILEANLISDISPLVNLKSLIHLNLGENPLNEDAYDIYIPQIAANNPGIYILHERREHHFVISAGPGGSIVSPGEGDFTYEGRTDIVVEAKADPGFVFAGFTGTYTESANPFCISVDEDFEIRAHFISTSAILYVDDDAPGDPGAGNAGISDSRENGTREHPFDSIQEAVEVAGEGVTIVVRAGTYHERIDPLGKRIELTGFDPNEPGAAAWPVFDGGGTGPIVSFTHGEDPNCLLAGFVLMAGKGRTIGAIQCSASSPTLSNCLIVGNRATDWNGAAVVCTNSHAVFVNCTIADNQAGEFGAALRLVSSQVTIVNSILWGDAPKEIQTEGAGASSIRYSLVANGWLGTGNLRADPLFISRGRWVDRDHPDTAVETSNPNAVWVVGDYHLQSQAGRWDPMAGQWVQDTATSPCIDAGDPDSPTGRELPPNGGVVNIGVYGGTVEASKSIVLPAQ